MERLWHDVVRWGPQRYTELVFFGHSLLGRQPNLKSGFLVRLPGRRLDFPLQVIFSWVLLWHNFKCIQLLKPLDLFWFGFVFWEEYLISLGWPGTCCISHTGLEFTILLH